VDCSHVSRWIGRKARLTDIERDSLVNFVAKIDGGQRGRALGSCRRDNGKASERLESVSQHSRQLREKAGLETG